MKFSYNPVVAKSHTPPYKIHKYFARRPWNVFEQLVENFSNEKEIILDPFCGGGVTIYEGIKKNRKVVGCDLNPLSIFIVSNMVKRASLSSEFHNSINELKKYLIELNGQFYKFEHNGTFLDVDWCELAFKVQCNICLEPTYLSNKLKKQNGSYACVNPRCSSNNSGKKLIEAKNCRRLGYDYLYLVNCERNSGKIVKKFDAQDIDRLNKHLLFLESIIKKEKIIIPSDKIPLDWDRQFEDGLSKKGIKSFQDLFTKRNLLLLTLLLQKIKKYSSSLPPDEYQLLRVVFSNTVKDTNIMAFTNETWQGGKPTTWSKHAYWIPSQFCEVAILPAFNKSIQRVLLALQYNRQQSYDVKKAKNFEDLKCNNLLLYNKSLASTNIPDNSVDSIITDPPYGSNVQYLELSHFWYVWNNDMYYSEPLYELEAVSNRKKGFKGAKSMSDYENNLYSVFLKSYKVLKPNKYMVLTFNNKDIGAWLALLISIFKSGFTLSPNGIFFQDGVKNYKQTAHTKADGSPFGDFIYSFQKAKPQFKLKVYKSEDEFYLDISAIFDPHINGQTDNKNDTIIKMFFKAVPLIESFAKTYLRDNKHNLYSKFKKDYFNKLYQNG